MPLRARAGSGLISASTLFALLAVSGASAVLPPQVYENARAEATYHVQVKIATVSPPSRTPGDCETTGEVVRIFRDKSGTLRLGTRVDFTVSCMRRGDPPIIGGTLWTDYDALMRARYLEAFLNPGAGRYHVAAWQSRIIEAVTDKPTIGSTSAATPATPHQSPGAAGDPYAEGMRLYNAKQDRAAIPFFDRAIAANPRRAEAYAGRGMAYHALGDYPRAIEDYTAAIRLKPDWQEPYIYRGKSYRSSRQTDRAIEDFTSAARVNPRSGLGHFERAATRWMFDPNMPASTLKDLDEAIRREPDNAHYYNLRGVVLTSTDNFQRAIADFDRTITLAPTMAIAYGNRGLAKYFLNRKAEAAEDIRRCLVLDPSMQRWLDQQVAMIPAVQQWQADFMRWYREIQRDAARTRDDQCSTKYAGHGARIQNCRSHGMNDTEERIRKGAPGL
jgi:tetratricopeptide (TPR) repeat protein